jgi:hypothetical protein
MYIKTHGFGRKSILMGLIFLGFLCHKPAKSAFFGGFRWFVAGNGVNHRSSSRGEIRCTPLASSNAINVS